MSGHKETERHRQAFEVYYQSDRDYMAVAERFSVSGTSVRKWCDWFGWRSRADRRDEEARKKADKEAIARRAAMLKRHRQAAELMQRRGMERLTGNKIASDRDALSAIKEGVALERQVEGMPSWVVEILNADADKLESLIADLTRGLAASDSPGDATAAGASVPVTVGSNGNGKH